MSKKNEDEPIVAGSGLARDFPEAYRRYLNTPYSQNGVSFSTINDAMTAAMVKVGNRRSVNMFMKLAQQDARNSAIRAKAAELDAQNSSNVAKDPRFLRRYPVDSLARAMQNELTFSPADKPLTADESFRAGLAQTEAAAREALRDGTRPAKKVPKRGPTTGDRDLDNMMREGKRVTFDMLSGKPRAVNLLGEEATATPGEIAEGRKLASELMGREAAKGGKAADEEKVINGHSYRKASGDARRKSPKSSHLNSPADSRKAPYLADRESTRYFSGKSPYRRGAFWVNPQGVEYFLDVGNGPGDRANRVVVRTPDGLTRRSAQELAAQIFNGHQNDGSFGAITADDIGRELWLHSRALADSQVSRRTPLLTLGDPGVALGEMLGDSIRQNYLRKHAEFTDIMHGDTKLDPLERMYGSWNGGFDPADYDTPLPEDAKKAYESWRASLPERLRSTDNYDLQGVWLERLGRPERYDPEQGSHLDDYGKKPNHPTFSTDSKWHDAGIPERTGGRWERAGDGSWDFYPASGNRMTDAELETYFGTEEPGARVHPRGDGTNQAAKGGDAGSASDEPVPQDSGASSQVVEEGSPRIVINPAVFEDKRDALCVAFNEAFRLVMEENGFEPLSEPTEKQRRFFADTAYADNELQLRRTILARIATLDTSVSDPTDEQLEETAEMLETVMEVGAPQNDWEQQAVQRLHDVVVKAREASAGPVDRKSPDMV